MATPPPEVVQSLGELFLGTGKQVAVDAQRDGGIGVTHPLGDSEGIGALVDQEAGVAVADVVGTQRLGQAGGAAGRAGSHPGGTCPG